MKILISSHFFYPQVGGTETVGRLLAEEFAAAGHQVRVVTTTAETDARTFPFELLRRPSPLQLLRAVQWCDVYFHNNISLQTAWPLLFVRRPWLIAHHVWIPRGRQVGWRVRAAGAVKRWVIRRARSVSISRAVAEHIGVPSEIIPNPYQDDVFNLMSGVERDRELVFVGRLVSDKGVDLLIHALALLRKRGLTPRLTVAGSGPEEAALRELARTEGVAPQVNFAGPHTGADLARILNAHQVIVIPSRWAEPFGLVALEGIACGCVPVGSEQGGLAEAIGPGGLTFENSSVSGLALKLQEALCDAGLRDRLLANAKEHLLPHSRKAVGEAYLRVMLEMARTPRISGS